MKVYVVMEYYPYEGGEVISVYSTPELAEKAVAAMGPSEFSGSYYEVKEFTVDD